MRFQRTLPPAAAPLAVIDILDGLKGILNKEKSFTRLKQTITEEFGTPHFFFVSSGKAAITLTLQALLRKHPERTLVLTPSFNCYSVPSAIIRAGCTVITCDIDPVTLQYDESQFQQILKKTSSSVLAVLATHFWGLPFDTDHLKAMIHDPAIMIIEDAAQAMGSIFMGTPAGTKGDIGIFSLSRGKAISAGEGGIIITGNKSIAQELGPVIATLPNYSGAQIFKLVIMNIALSILVHPSLFWLPKMLPFLKIGETVFESDFPLLQLSAFQAGLLKNWKKKLAWLLQERSKWVNLYTLNLKDCQHVRCLPQVQREQKLSCIRYPIIVLEKTHYHYIISESNKQGLGISPTYPGTINSIPEANIPKGSVYTNAQFLVDNVVTLPCHPLVRTKDFEAIVELLKRAAHL
jgi:dTDP-4-amino-4,6-dideoxygalactose transaminase